MKKVIFEQNFAYMVGLCRQGYTAILWLKTFLLEIVMLLDCQGAFDCTAFVPGFLCQSMGIFGLQRYFFILER